MPPLSILVVEDEPLIAMLLEDFVRGLGHEISGGAENLEAALACAEAGGFDAAILDVNLKGRESWPVAEALQARDIPFVLATGGAIHPPPERYSEIPILEKPYTMAGVRDVLGRLADLRNAG